MVSIKRNPSRLARMQRVKSLVGFVIALMIVSIHLINVSARYVPISVQQDHDPMAMARRQDFDEEDDELDSNASAPYQNQEDNGTNNNGDGYEETEPDGPYEETAREQEGQADLERFFDDHLGASDRDGMDKENLPSNLVPRLEDPSDKQIQSSNLEQASKLANIQTEFLQLPDEKLIITRQTTRKTGPRPDDNRRNQVLPVPVIKFEANDNMTSNEPKLKEPNWGSRLRNANLEAKGSQRILATENDEFDPVYVTHDTDEPFKIAALGGFDPEQDFIDASRDIEEEPVRGSAGPLSEGRGRETLRQGQGLRRSSKLSEFDSKDEAANDDSPDMETMFEDASETDEITFDQEDPFQTDLEAEMRQQAFDRVNVFNVDAPIKATSQNIQRQTVDRRLAVQTNDAYTRAGPDLNRQNIDDTGRDGLDGVGDDDDEGKWAHDGVEDMEIPTEARQNQVLDRASKHESLVGQQATLGLAKPTDIGEVDSLATSERVANDAEDPSNAATDDNNNGDEDEPNGRRMPNADYLKEEDIDR